MQTPSSSLLDLLRLPDQSDAWEKFFRLFAPLIHAWAKQQGLQDADAADLTQNVLVKLVRLLPNYRRGEGQTFRGWLSRVTRNECQDFRRRRATRALPGPDGLATVFDPPPTDLDEADYRLGLVRHALTVIRPAFSDKTWAAFTAFVLNDRPAATVAAELGLSANAVYLARNRILTHLREELQGLDELLE